jgi:hypothetical protein
VKGILGEERATQLLSESAYLIVAGSDDLANPYFSSPLWSSRYDFSSYSNFILQGASSFIQVLFSCFFFSFGQYDT